MTEEERRAKRAAYMREYYRLHPEKRSTERAKAYGREYMRKLRSTEAGREKSRSINRKSYQSCNGKEYAQAWRLANPEKVKAIQYKANHSEKGKQRKERHLKTEKCRLTTRAFQKRYRKTESGKRMYFASDLKKHYGLTVEKYNEMLNGQGRVCSICKLFRVSGKAKRLCVDHDAQTGKVRELLCTFCNTAIGLLMDDPGVCERAAQYLLKHGKLPVAWRSIVETA